jgi:hypothetical protein
MITVGYAVYRPQSWLRILLLLLMRFEPLRKEETRTKIK